MATAKPADIKSVKVSAEDGGFSVFDFHKATPGVADLMRRLYSIRIECGEGDEADKEANEKAEKQRLALKQLDAFEYKKYLLMQEIDSTRKMVKDSKQEPDNARLKNDIRKKLKTIKDGYDELKKLQDSTKKADSVWAKVKMTPELRAEREKNLRDVQQHIQSLENMNRNANLGTNNSRNSRNREPQFGSVDDMQDEQEELPTVDISDALKIIENNKKEQDRLLDVIDKQVDKMMELAKGFEAELNVQAKLLDNIDKDIDKYNKELEGLNKTLDSAIEKVGGPTRLLFILIGVIILFACIGIAVVAIQNATGKGILF